MDGHNLAINAARASSQAFPVRWSFDPEPDWTDGQKVNVSLIDPLPTYFIDGFRRVDPRNGRPEIIGMGFSMAAKGCDWQSSAVTSNSFQRTDRREPDHHQVPDRLRPRADLHLFQQRRRGEVRKNTGVQDRHYSCQYTPAAGKGASSRCGSPPTGTPGQRRRSRPLQHGGRHRGHQGARRAHADPQGPGQQPEQ